MGSLVLPWLMAVLFWSAKGQSSYSYSYDMLGVDAVSSAVPPEDNWNGTKKKKKKKTKKRGFENDYDFDYPPPESPDDSWCKDIKASVVACMHSVGCTGDDDAAPPADDDYGDLGDAETDREGRVSVCSATQHSAAFRKECNKQLRGCPDCVGLYHAYVECVFGFYVNKYWAGGFCEFSCDGGAFSGGGRLRPSSGLVVTAPVLGAAAARGRAIGR